MGRKLHDKFIVIKNEDIKRYLTPTEQDILNELLTKIEVERADCGKKQNNYLVVNKDESYAELVKKLILGEIAVDEITEVIARNCVAWDTSKDKREGLLPEVAVFSNPYLYEKLTGEKYNQFKAIRRFHIGES